MSELEVQALYLAPVLIYIYAQAKSLVAWDGTWRLMSGLLCASVTMGVLVILRFDTELVRTGIQLGSIAASSVIVLLWAIRGLLNSTH